MKKLNTIQKKWIYRALIMLIFVFSFLLRADYLNTKEGLHIDEHWSFILSSYKDIGWCKDIPEGTYTAGELKSLIYTPTDPSLKGAFSDVFRLWESTRDSPHTNFYYSILRLSFVGVDASDNIIQDLMFRASILNLLTYCAVFVSFFVFLKSLLPNRSLILVGLVILSLNPFDIGNILLFRPYVFQTLFVMIFTSYLINIAKQIKADVYKDSWQNLLKFSFPLSLLLMVGYYGFVFAFFVGIAFVLFVLKPSKKLNLVPFFFTACFVAVAFDSVYYQEFFKGFYEYRASGSMNNLFDVFGSISIIYSKFVKYDLEWVLYLSLLLFIFALLALKNRRMSSFYYLNGYFWLISSTVVACGVILFIVEVKNLRYIVAYMPIILAYIPLFYYGIGNKKYRSILSVSTVLIFVVMSLFSMKINKCFKMNHQFKNDISHKTNIPIYLATPVVGSGAVSQLWLYANRSKFVLKMNNDTIINVVDVELSFFKEEALAQMHKKYDMPKEFILYYTKLERSGEYGFEYVGSSTDSF